MRVRDHVGLARLIRLEIRELLRHSPLAAAIAVFSGVLLLSGLAACLDVQQVARTKATAAAAERER